MVADDHTDHHLRKEKGKEHNATPRRTPTLRTPVSQSGHRYVRRRRKAPDGNHFHGNRNFVHQPQSPTRRCPQVHRRRCPQLREICLLDRIRLRPGRPRLLEAPSLELCLQDLALHRSRARPRPNGREAQSRSKRSATGNNLRTPMPHQYRSSDASASPTGTTDRLIRSMQGSGISST